MFGFLKQVGDYTRDAVDAARNLAQGFSVTFDHMQRRPVTVQYPYEKLIPSERYRGRIHYCLLYTSPSPRDLSTSRMPSSA